MTKPANTSLARPLPEDVTVSVLASADRLGNLETELTERFGKVVDLVAVDPSQPIPGSVILASSLIVVEIDPSQPGSLARINQVRDSSPSKPLIAAVTDMDMPTVRTLLRRGVNDVIALPFDADELVSAVIDLASLRADAPLPLAPMVGISHSSGGVGASTVATHLAAALSQNFEDTRCCLVDLDLQYGELASLLGVESVSNVVDCLDAGDRMDLDIVQNAVVEARDNLSILSVPEDVTPPEGIDTDQILKLLILLRQNYDYVILDLPSGWTEWSLSAACACDELLLVVDQSIRGLRRAKKTVGLLESVDFAPQNVKLVVNRAEKKLFQAIASDDVADALSREVVATLPVVKSGLRQMQEQGQLASEVDPKSGFIKAVDGLAEWVMFSGEETEA